MPNDTLTPLDKKGTKHVQWVVGSFLYYDRAVNNIILTALNKILAAQAPPIAITTTKIQMLLDY